MCNWTSRYDESISKRMEIELEEMVESVVTGDNMVTTVSGP
jgi:hypothetical protein